MYQKLNEKKVSRTARITDIPRESENVFTNNMCRVHSEEHKSVV